MPEIDDPEPITTEPGTYNYRKISDPEPITTEKSVTRNL